MMKIFSHILLATASFLCFWGCSENDVAPIVDCSLSNLSIEVVSTVAADCNAPGSLTVTSEGGSGVIMFTADRISYQASPVIANLGAGDYTVTAMDENGCTASVSTRVEPVAGSVSLQIAADNVTCGNSTGVLTVVASGGVIPYTYSLNGANFQSSNVFNAVSNGLHAVTVRDANDCEVSKSEVLSSGVSLSQDIMPIFVENCAVTGCHVGSRNPDMRSIPSIIKNAAKIKARTSERTMPPFGKPELTDEQINLIGCWVDEGALEN